MFGKKRKCMSITEKLNILKVVDESHNKKRVVIAKELGMSPSTLNTIIAKKNEIEESARVLGVSSDKRSRIQGGKYEHLEEGLWQWFQQYRAENIPISRPMLSEKAVEIAASLSIDNFRASSSWLHKFKLRRGICTKSMCGKNRSVNLNTAREWKAGFLQPTSVTSPTPSGSIPEQCRSQEMGHMQDINPNQKQAGHESTVDCTHVTQENESAKGSVAASTPELHHSFEPSHVRKGAPYKVPNQKQTQEEELEMILLHLKRQILLLEVEKLSEERERIAVEKRNITLRNNILALRTKMCESEKTSSTLLISHVSSPAVSLNRSAEKTECVGSRAVKGSVKGSSILVNQAVDTLSCTHHPHKSCTMEHTNPKQIPNSTQGVDEDRIQPADGSSSVKTPESVLPYNAHISESMHHPIPPVTVASDPSLPKQKEPANEQMICNNNIDSGHTLSCKETETSEHMDQQGPSSTFMNGCTALSEQMVTSPVQSGEPYFKDLDKKPPSQTLFPYHESLNSGEAFNDFYVVSSQVGDESASGTVKRDSSEREEPTKKRKLEH